MQNQEENENLENEEPTGEQQQTKRGRGWPKGKPRKQQIDAGSLAPSVDGRESDGMVYDAEEGEVQTSRGRSVRMPPNVLQIGLISLIVSVLVVFAITSYLTPMVGRSGYRADITRIENDLVNARGNNYVSGTSLMSLKAQYDDLNTRSNAFLVQGDLDGYATTSALNSLRSSIPTADSIASSATTQVNAKLAQVDAKIAQVNTALSALGNSTDKPLDYNLVGSSTNFVLSVKSDTAGWYAARVILNYSIPVPLGNTTSSDAEIAFFNKIALSASPTPRTLLPQLIYQAGIWKVASAYFYTAPFQLSANAQGNYSLPIVEVNAFTTIPNVYIEIVQSSQTTTTPSTSGL